MGLAELLGHLVDHLFHGLFRYFLLLNRLYTIDLYHGQGQRVMRLVVLGVDLFLDAAIGVIIDIVLFEIGEDYVSLFGLLRVYLAVV